MGKRIFLQVEMASEEEKEAFKLWCQFNKVEMSSRVRELIAQDIKEGIVLTKKLREP